MRIFWIMTSLAVAITVVTLGLFLWWNGSGPICKTDEICIREWMSATSGWAAVVVAIPTILFLSKQVRDADRHQRTSFEIQLRRQRILAIRTAQIAYTALLVTEPFITGVEDGLEPDMRSWDRETVENIIHILRDETLAAFENEIAFPMSMGAKAMARVIETAYAGIHPAVHTGPALTKAFFENLAKQADDYLAEVRKITAHP